MAGQATRIGVLAGELREAHDLARVATAVDVRSTRAVTGFTPVGLFQACLKMNRGLG